MGMVLTGTMILIVFLTGLWLSRKGTEGDSREK
jgi:hypothetical protein